MTRAAPAERITSGPIDPDLEQALPELAAAARRIRQLESIIRIPNGSYATRAAQLAERSDLYEAFTTRAEKLKLPGEKPGRTLLLLTEEADRLYRQGARRRPTLAQVLVSMRAIAATAANDADAADVDLIAARYRAAEARARAAAGQGAVTYLENCCG